MKTTYQWDAQDYNLNSANQQRWAREMLASLQLTGAERILDIGCGEGKVTAELAQRVPKGAVVGVDVSPEMIGLAEKLFLGKAANVTFQHADASALPFHNEFDVVVSFNCLHWVKDHLPVLEGIEQSLKPSGRVLLQFGGRGVDKVVDDISEPVISAKKWRPYFINFEFPWYFYGPEDYKVWVQEAGLNAQRVEIVPHEGVFTPEQFKGWIRATWVPYLQRVPPDRREDLVSEMVDQYLMEHPVDREGVIHLSFNRLEVEATKG
jgi:trans-aconitate 2-methyltransferase